LKIKIRAGSMLCRHSVERPMRSDRVQNPLLAHGSALYRIIPAYIHSHPEGREFFGFAILKKLGG
jgi:hypothetical protein